VYANYGMCPNSVGTNALGTEFNGTFGSGVPQNRGTSANAPTGYTYATFTSGSPQDYYYGLANNTSNGANFSTSNAWPKPDNSTPTHRVFNVWDIIGHHTGATDPYAGNAPGNNTNASGYMLVINAAYRIDSAFQQTISGLCPNTYYEIACWVRNICSKCGCDVNGVGATSGSSAYIPTAPGDSSGVYPNLTFEVDGADYYTTGNLLYTGILSFSAKADREKIRLQWTTDREEGPVQYVVERSMSRSAFTAIATLPGRNGTDALNTYYITDVADASQEVQYRIRLSIGSYNSFSRTIQLHAKVAPQLALTNPFSDVLQVRFMSTESGLVQVVLYDMKGQVVRRQQWVATEGMNQVQVQNVDLLPDGLYTVQLNGKALLATLVLKRKK
jgi:hypothetical protein